MPDSKSTRPRIGTIVPINQLPIKRGPGRPRKIEKKPSDYDLEYHAEVAVRRQEWVAEHPLVKQNPMPTGASAIDKLNLVKASMAKEAATLEFNRIELEKRGLDTSQISSRIVSALNKISGIELETKKLGHTVVDPKSTAVQNIFKLWVSALQETLSSLVESGTLDEPTMDLLFNTFSNKMEGWEDRVEEG